MKTWSKFGGTWTPASNFMLSTTIGLQKRYQNSSFAQFDENDYPMTFTAWYAPTTRWTVSGGLGFYSNWIDQEITIGKGHNTEGVYDLPFEYGGRSHVVNFGTTYACTDRLTLSGGYEYVRGKDVFADPSTGAISLEYLPGASDVLVDDQSPHRGHRLPDPRRHLDLLPLQLLRLRRRVAHQFVE